MPDRSATDIIKGYFYQFDKSIEQILKLPEDTDSILVEEIEDIDVNTATGTTAIQCKYYSKTEYNHSVIAKQIRYMLTHYKKLKENNKPFLKYMIYGKYKSGEDKLFLPLNKDYLIENFLSFTKNKIKRFHHTELGLSGKDLDKFITLLKIDIDAKDYNEQYQSILNLFKFKFSCTDFEAEHYYYNNALSIIKNLTVKKTNRKITKERFLREIDKKQLLFNTWFLKLKGEKVYYKTLKDQYFKSGLNTSPFERFFLIDVPKKDITTADVKMLILSLHKKWSKLSEREKQSYCPYIYIHGIGDDVLVEIKTRLRDEGYYCIDGYDFYKASFCAKSITKQATYHNDIKLKIINQIEHIGLAIAEITKTIEIYQFYIESPYYRLNDSSIKHIKIQVDKFRYIKEITT